MAIPLLACGVGLVLSLLPMWVSAFRLVPGDAGDMRFVQLLMEYSYQWIGGRMGNLGFWDPPVFYPVKNTLAYSETLLGVAPFYWLWRALGVGPDTSYSLWLILMVALNFAAAYMLLKKDLRFETLAASAGAFLIAFGSPRIAQLNHPQLTPVFFGILAISFLLRRQPFGFGAMMLLQFYSGYYTAVFLVIGLIIALLASLFIKERRRQLLYLVQDRRQAAAWVGAGLASCAFLFPMAVHYLEASKTVGVRQYWHVEAWLPRIQSWFYLGESSWLYGWLHGLRPFQVLPMAHEQQAGIGWVTSALVVLGFVALWKRSWQVRIFACVLAVLLVSSTYVVPNLSLWRIWYLLVPGVAAMRSVSRICIFLLLPAGVGLAAWVQAKPKGWLLACGLALVLLEQGRTIPTFDIRAARRTIELIRTEVESQHCEIFYAGVWPGKEAPWKYQIDAMWAAVETGVPTFNGYSGNFPAGWDLYNNLLSSRGYWIHLGQAADAWAGLNGIPPAKVCKIAVQDPVL